MHRLDVILFQFLFYYRVIVPIDERVVFCLVLDYAHLRIDVVLHAVVITVEVVRGYVKQYGDVRAEVVHIVKLERT